MVVAEVITKLAKENNLLGGTVEATRSRPLPQGGESLSTVNLRSEIYFEIGSNFLSQATFLFITAVLPYFI